MAYGPKLSQPRSSAEKNNNYMTQATRTKYLPPVSIIGTGACSAVGYSAPTTVASVKAGINRIAEHPYMVDSHGDAFITAHAQYLPALMDCIERCWKLGLSAATEALGVIGSLPAGIKNIPVIIGLPGNRPGFTEKMAGEIAARFQDFIHPLCQLAPVETLRGGHSVGLMALEKGCDIISKGHAPLCLVGGIDSLINADDLEWLDLQGMLHSSSNPWGMVPGEGTGFCLLASEKARDALALPARAKILAGATAMEKNLINTNTVCTGEGLCQAISLVTQESEPEELGKIDQIICDLNGLRYRADEFGFTLVKNGKLFTAPGDFIAPADNWGDVGAASGPLFVSLAVHTALQGNEKGPTNLLLAGSDTGERSAMVIQTIKQQGSIQ
jgi:3-oxoacyl-[acyl-carrier-protein] synthase I